ncbi:hypothetical protein Pla108_31810 [Botrimarina colliarenosi]|uniref:VWFA domain-containing protein n=1 Tax=Botrimarina colliarenosi TaxID=2528001 RepID=A0A5C6A974_9BACT|nr:vWA domain-containing protein [Botrimarina colliarenosi]TWT96099.1 hypothetical protein Pla108_31810 [Botrimarina colliarenosi]
MNVYDAVGYETLTQSPGWAATLIGLAVAAIVLAVACGWRERRVAPRGWVVLLVLRVLAVAAAGLVIAGVERRPLSEQEVPSRVVLLIDRSASMTLPATDEPGDTTPRSAPTKAVADQLATVFAERHDVSRAGFDVAVNYQSPTASPEAAPGATDNTTDAGGATRLGSALQRVLSDYGASPLAAVVVVSDGGWNAGPDPVDPAALAKSRDVPVHTIGVGPLREPPSIGLRDLAAPSRAATGDAFQASVTVAANGAGAAGAGTPRVTLTLRPLGADGKTGAAVLEEPVEFELPREGGLAGGTAELTGPAPGLYELTATLVPAGRDADLTDNALSTPIEFVDQPTRVLLAAGGPARDYHFLRDQLYRDEQFTCDVLLQSATGAVTQDAGKVLVALPATAAEWEAYDVLAAIDLDWRQVEPATQAALAEWVSSRGGGLAFVAGPVAMPGVLRAGLETPLRTLLPVMLRDDPLALGSSLGVSRDPRPIYLTGAGRGLGWLDLRLPNEETTSVWRRLDGFYSPTIPAEPKPGATVLAKLGEEDSAPPLLVEQLYGAGRVAYLSTPETWRLRTVSADSFTALHVGWLRHLTQGRLLGVAAEGSLLFDRRRYDLGETMTLRYVARETSTPTPPPPARLIVGDGPAEEVRLDPVEGQPGVFSASVRATATGRWTATVDRGSSGREGSDRLTATAEASLPALENETRVQNAKLLAAIAQRSGGRYVDLASPGAQDQWLEIARNTLSLAETTIDLGAPDERFAERLSRFALAAMAGALLLEWLLRRAWRLA